MPNLMTNSADKGPNDFVVTWRRSHRRRNIDEMITNVGGTHLQTRSFTGNLSPFFFTSTKSCDSLPPNNSLHLMTSNASAVGAVYAANEQLNLPILADQPCQWPHRAFSKADEIAILSDPSHISGDNIDCLAVEKPVPRLSVPSEETPISRFFKHGVLIRKPTLSRPRKRKGLPAHKNEIFGSPFNTSYFAKPLGSGLSSDRIAARGPHLTKKGL